MNNLIYIILFLSKNLKDSLIKIFKTQEYKNELMEKYLEKNLKLWERNFDKKSKKNFNYRFCINNRIHSFNVNYW